MNCNKAKTIKALHLQTIGIASFLIMNKIITTYTRGYSCYLLLYIELHRYPLLLLLLYFLSFLCEPVSHVLVSQWILYIIFQLLRILCTMIMV